MLSLPKERSCFFESMDPIQWQWHRELLRILVRPAAGEVLSFSLCTAPWVIESASAIAHPAAAAAEHDVNDKTFRPPDGDKFYITTAINYTNGRAPSLSLSLSRECLVVDEHRQRVRGETQSAAPILLCGSALACRAAAHGPCIRGRHHRCPRKIPSHVRPAGPQQRWYSSIGRRSGYSASCTFGVGLVGARAVWRCGVKAHADALRPLSALFAKLRGRTAAVCRVTPQVIQWHNIALTERRTFV